MAQPISVGAAVFAGFEFVRRGLVAAPGPAVLLFASIFASMAAFSNGAMIAWGLACALCFLFGVAFAGGLCRTALDLYGGATGLGARGPGGFQWAGAEWRLLAVSGLLIALQATALFIAFVLIGLALAPVAPQGVLKPPVSASDLGHWLAAALAALLVLCGYYWIRVRLLLAPVASVALGKIAIGTAFALTKGQYWRLLAASLVLALPMVGIGFVAGFLKGFFRAFGASGAGTFFYQLILAAGAAAYTVPAGVGLAAFVYAQLHGGPQRAADVF